MEKYGNKFLFSKKLLVILGLLFVAWSVAIGLIVYYAGVSNINQGDGVASEAEPEPEATAEPNSQPAVAAKKVTDVRLPRHLLPERYTLKLVPFLKPDNFTIRGYVEIEMYCDRSGSNVTLHTADMLIQNETVKVQDQNGNSVSISKYDYDKDREFFIVHLTNNLQRGKKYTIKIFFTAYLKDNLKGFYRSVYTDRQTNKEEYIAVTQFQATDARRAFPCFDEPGIKAKFKVSLGRTRDMSSIANMPVREAGVEMSDDPEYVWDHYTESVQMSTYLVAFVVSKFDKRQSELRANNVTFRIWSRADAVGQTEYARDIGPKMLEFFENYFQVKFPLPKQDMIAIPDFGAGAMENWGLITYRETALLYEEGVSSLANLQRIAIVVSHELAHQWFGNLVTPSWWTDLWLNEGFASYVEYLGVDAIQPSFKLLEQFIVYDLQDVLRIDALESSHPISIPVKHPDEISEIFDRISYGKGASIIRMMDKFLTSQTFKKGLTNYLNDLKFAAATQDDLWRHLTKQGHSDGTLPAAMTVKGVMDTWTLQTGFPLLTVQRNYEDDTAVISQTRFLLRKGEPSSEMWWIPITHTHPGGDFNNTKNTIWLSNKEKSKTIEGMPNNKPVIFNIQETGYYRVNYDKRNWDLIAYTLMNDHKSIHVINRAQILDDALELAKVGLLDYGTALSLTGYLAMETEYIPWVSAISGLAHIDTLLKRTSAYGDFRGYMLRLLAPIYQRVGFHPKPEDQHLDVLLRKVVAKWACKAGHEECQAKAVAKFRNWMDTIKPDAKGNNPVDVNMKSITYCNAVANGGEEEWNFAWQRYEKSNVASEKAILLSAMACTKEVWLLNRFLNMSITPSSGVRKQDGGKVIVAVAKNTVGSLLAFDFLSENWRHIKDYFSGFSAIKRAVKQIVRSITTPFQLEELKKFKKENQNQLGTSKRALDQAVESGEANVSWMKDNYQVVWDWVKEYNSKTRY